MEQNSFLPLLFLGLRIIGAIFCYKQAKWLNRNTVGWTFAGFIFPIIAMIWVYNLSSKKTKSKEISFSTKYYTKNGVIEVENEGERKVLINEKPAPDGNYKLNRFETIDVLDGRIQ